MVVQFFYLSLLFLCSIVTSEWVEISQITVNKQSKLQNGSSLVKLTTSSTPVIAVFTETVETTILSSIPIEQPTKNKGILIQNLPMVKHPYPKVTDFKKAQIGNITLLEITNNGVLNISNENTKFENVKASKDSDVINETLKEAKSDLFNKPNTSLSQKLKYLHKMEGEMSAQIKKLSQGLWADRQARGKKLLGFASMEGALMTIAFLTFAVFLVKVVQQCIQGLQNSELAMVELPTTPALRLSRPKRQQSDLAAAQLLRYMDEFRVAWEADQHPAGSLGGKFGQVEDTNRV